MRDELTAPSLEMLHERRDVPVDIAIELGMELVNSGTGPIVGFTERAQQPGETGDVHQYISYIQKTAAFSPNGLANPDNTGGSSTNPQNAKIAALGEAIERYCLSLSDPDDFLTTTYGELNQPALDPLEMNAFSDRQLKDRDLTDEQIRTSEYHWTMAREMTTGEAVLVPGQLIYLPFSSPTVIRSPSTTGAATGIDFESACYRALCEIIERECFIIGYLNKLSFPRIDLSTVDDQDVTAFRTELRHRNKEVHVLDITLDHPFHACLAIAVDRDSQPALSLGLDADVDMKVAIRGALREALQISTWDAFEEPFNGDPGEIETLEERAAFWAPQDCIDNLDFWLNTDVITECPVPICDRSEALDVARSYLDENEYHWYVVDVTTPDIRRQGFKTVGTVVPAFHPMHLIEWFKYLGSKRLYDIPVETGYLTEPHAESELNSIPHPFL